MNEELRKFIIELLLNSDIYIYHKGKKERIYNYDEKNKKLFFLYEELKELQKRRKIKDTILPDGIDNTDYDTLIKDKQEEFNAIRESQVIYIKEDTNMEKISEDIKNVYEEYEKKLKLTI